METTECLKFAKDLNLKLENKTLEEIFRMIDKDGSGEIDFEEFILWYKTNTSGVELTDLFQKYSRLKDYMLPQDLEDFLTKLTSSIMSSLSFFISS